MNMNTGYEISDKRWLHSIDIKIIIEELKVTDPELIARITNTLSRETVPSRLSKIETEFRQASFDLLPNQYQLIIEEILDEGQALSDAAHILKCYAKDLLKAVKAAKRMYNREVERESISKRKKYKL